MSKPLRIAVAGDANYLAGAIGTLAGIRLALEQSVPVEVAFLHDGLDSASKDRLLRALSRVRGAMDVRFVHIDGKFPGFPDFYFASKLTYARLLLPELLDWPRIIYIDVDFLVLRSLQPLCEIDLPESGFAAAIERCKNKISGDPPAASAGIPVNPDADYFNAGLLVLDLAKTKASRLFDRASEILIQHKQSCKFWDQSALNYAANGMFNILGQEWNTQTHRMCFDPVAVIRSLADRSINVHFVTSSKPWLSHSPFPADTMFRMLLDRLDPSWRGCEYAHLERAARFKFSVSAVLGTFYRSRALLKKNPESDLRTAAFWEQIAADRNGMSKRATEVKSLLEGWANELSEKIS